MQSIAIANLLFSYLLNKSFITIYLLLLKILLLTLYININKASFCIAILRNTLIQIDVYL